MNARQRWGAWTIESKPFADTYEVSLSLSNRCLKVVTVNTCEEAFKTFDKYFKWVEYTHKLTKEVLA